MTTELSELDKFLEKKIEKKLDDDFNHKVRKGFSQSSQSSIQTAL